MSKRILLVEEDVMGLNMLSQLLSFKGYEVCALHRSERILNEIPKCHPDLILLDKELTGIRSDVITRTLQLMDGVNKIPVLQISGKVYGASRAQQQDAWGFVPNIDDLVQQIEHHLVN